MPVLDSLDGTVWLGSPNEGLGVGVMLLEVPLDRALQIDQRGEAAAPEPAPGRGGEEALDRVRPG